MLACLAFAVAVHTANVEGVFSAQKAREGRLTNRLYSSSLNAIAVIELEGPHWMDFNYIASLQAFRRERTEVFKTCY